MRHMYTLDFGVTDRLVNIALPCPPEIVIVKCLEVIQLHGKQHGLSLGHHAMDP